MRVQQCWSDLRRAEGRLLRHPSFYKPTCIRSVSTFRAAQETCLKRSFTLKPSTSLPCLLTTQTLTDLISLRSRSRKSTKSDAGNTTCAHRRNAPNILIEIEDKSAYSLGYLIYFFEFACGVSGYVLGVNPFNQPGVEDYKKNMFALLGKPGYEEQKITLEARLK